MLNRAFGRPHLVLVTLVAIAAALGLPAPGTQSTHVAAALAVFSTETVDIIHMRDGRELTGQILQEDASQVVFRYRDPNLNLETTITLQRRDIVEIERDVAVESDDQPRDVEDENGRDSGPIERSRPSGLEQGLAEGDADDESLPAFYIIPMRGQMGTDIRTDAYERVVQEIRREQPELVIWLLDCADVDELMISQSDQAEGGLTNLIDDYRDLVRMLHDDLRGIRQVMWVHDSVGISSLMALAWEEMYMAPGARLTGFRGIYEGAARMGDADVAAKMVAAWIGIINGFLIRGGRPIELGEAMSRPQHKLSATWRGRQVEWRLDTSGEYIVNSSDERTAGFRAKTAEDFGISKGTAETVDELALLLGYREYRVIEGGAEQIITRYVENWRREFERCRRLWEDFAKHMSWATGDQAMRWISRANSDLGRIIAAMRRYPAIEIRFTMEYGVDLFTLEMLEEEIRERIRAMNQRNRDRGRGGGGGGGGGGGRHGF